MGNQWMKWAGWFIVVMAGVGVLLQISALFIGEVTLQGIGSVINAFGLLLLGASFILQTTRPQLARIVQVVCLVFVVVTNGANGITS